MKDKLNDYEGYLTIEASFIMPIVVIIIVQLLYLGFYCYDKSVSVQCCYLAALRASNEWELTNVQMEQLAYRNVMELTEEKLLFIHPQEQMANVFVTNVKVGINGRKRVFGNSFLNLEELNWNMESQKTAVYLKPSSYIRRRK